MEAHYYVNEVGGESQKWKRRKMCREGVFENETGGRMILVYIMGLIDYWPKPLEKKSWKIKHLVVICKGLSMITYLGKGRFRNIGLFCGLKGDYSRLWAEIIGSYWSREFFEPEGKILEQIAGNGCYRKKKKKKRKLIL